MYFLIIFSVFLISFAKGESCISPLKLNGTCKSIKECDILLKVVTKPGRNSLDEQFLRQSQCGWDGSSPKVCCPDSVKFPCVTPEGSTGECVDIKSCPNLLELLKDPNSNNAQYVSNSLCVSPAANSVCCGLKPNVTSTTVVNWCDKTVSALLPDQDGQCCGVDTSVTDKILGNATFIDQHPWLVVIEYITKLEKPKLLCGGSLISGKYVLTAAHCVTGAILRYGTPKNVRLGEYNVTNDGSDCYSIFGEEDCNDGMILAPIEETIPHPEYDPFAIEKHNDIALIRLKIFAPYTDFIRPICLPKIDYMKSPPNNLYLQVAGWGRYIQNITERGSIFKSSDVKRHVQLPYVPRDKCQAALRTLKGVEKVTITERHICAGGDAGFGSCKGDSGGPLVIENFIDGTIKFEAIGVLSTGAVICGQEGIPSVFTYVYKYVPWIKANMRP